MPIRLATFPKLAFAGLAALVATAAVSRADDKDDPKMQIVILYGLQQAPAICQWTGAADPAKLDGKIAEMEKALGITDDERTKFKALAEADIKKGTNCTDGLARAMYDEMAK